MSNTHHNPAEKFFEQSVCGFVITDGKGIIVQTNGRLAKWVSFNAAGELVGKKFSSLLSTGGRIYYETHLAPLLRMQGFFDEILLDLIQPNGIKMRVLINGSEERDEDNQPLFNYLTIIKASDRLHYEQSLKDARVNAEQALLDEKETVALREQLIGVLGHDLRNPLNAITMATSLLQHSIVAPDQVQLLATIKRSSYRITELISNIMEFTRTRLGSGMVIEKRSVLLIPVLQQVVSELELFYPKRNIITQFDLPSPVTCDPDRIGQLFSNLLANAFTHGAADTTVIVHASYTEAVFKLAVTNQGKLIPEDLLHRLFEPYTREGDRPSTNGLGLGLYIAHAIAKAHGGTLECQSNAAATVFTFSMFG